MPADLTSKDFPKLMVTNVSRPTDPRDFHKYVVTKLLAYLSKGFLKPVEKASQIY